MDRRRRQAGMTFFEVLASIAVFSIVAIGITKATVSNIKMNTDGRVVAAATALAQNQLEKLRAIVPNPTTVIATDPTTYPADLRLGAHADPNNPVTALGTANGSFTRTWSVSSVQQSGCTYTVNGVTKPCLRPGIVEVAVTVQWTAPAPAGSMTSVTYACVSPRCS